MSSYDDFFDEDGNLKNTSWGIKREQQEEEERQAQEAEEKRKKQREFSRHIAIDNAQSQFVEKHQKLQHQREINEKWRSLPAWIKRMPRPKMSDPPTQGTKEKMLTKITGKVHLTPEEERERKMLLMRVKRAIDDYESLSVPIDKSVLSPIPIIGIGDGAGTTVVTRALMNTLADNRPATEQLVAADFGKVGNTFSQWFSVGDNEKMFLRHVFRSLQTNQGGFDIGFLPTANRGRQKFISNSPVASRRGEVTTQNIALFYQSIMNNPGFFLMDCNNEEKEGVISGLALATTPIFVVPIQKNAGEKLSEILSGAMTVLTPQRYQDIVSRAIIAVSSPVPHIDSRDGREMVSSFMSDVADQAGITSGRAVHIPFDKELSEPPMRWNNISYGTGDSLRKVCRYIVEDIA